MLRYRWGPSSIIIVRNWRTRWRTCSSWRVEFDMLNIVKKDLATAAKVIKWQDHHI
jgi:hypothetical protein